MRERRLFSASTALTVVALALVAATLTWNYGHSSQHSSLLQARKDRMAVAEQMESFGEKLQQEGMYRAGSNLVREGAELAKQYEQQAGAIHTKQGKVFSSPPLGGTNAVFSQSNGGGNGWAVQRRAAALRAMYQKREAIRNDNTKLDAGLLTDNFEDVSDHHQSLQLQPTHMGHPAGIGGWTPSSNQQDQNDGQSSEYSGNWWSAAQQRRFPNRMHGSRLVLQPTQRDEQQPAGQDGAVNDDGSAAQEVEQEESHEQAEESQKHAQEEAENKDAAAAEKSAEQEKAAQESAAREAEYEEEAEPEAEEEFPSEGDTGVESTPVEQEPSAEAKEEEEHKEEEHAEGAEEKKANEEGVVEPPFGHVRVATGLPGTYDGVFGGQYKKNAGGNEQAFKKAGINYDDYPVDIYKGVPWVTFDPSAVNSREMNEKLEKDVARPYTLKRGRNKGQQVMPVGWGDWIEGTEAQDRLRKAGVKVDNWPIDIHHAIPLPAWDKSEYDADRHVPSDARYVVEAHRKSQENLEKAGVRLNGFLWDDGKHNYNNVDGISDTLVKQEPTPKYRMDGIAAQERPLNFLLDENLLGEAHTQKDEINNLWRSGPLDEKKQPTIDAEEGLEMDPNNPVTYASS